LNSRDDIVWMLWGAHAKSYAKLITNKSHHLVMSGHPSPLNRANPFIGSNCFVQCDKVLGEINKKKITWMN
jgi:uracil-DNA glycosylase